MMKKQSILKRLAAAALAAVLCVSLAACGQQAGGAEEAPAGQTQQPAQSADGKKIINLGVTYAPGTINPLSPVSEVASYVTGLMFLPLMEVDSNMQFQPMLAESVTTEDNLTFTIKLDPRAKWTDGEPVDADDLIFTIRCIANEKVGSIYTYMYANFLGFDENGFLPESGEAEGLVKVDDHTVQLIAKEPIAMNTFNNAISRCLWVIPEHVLKDVPPEELVASSFFQKPDVTNGPFTMIAYDRDHYVQLAANPDYFKGAPKIDQLNFNVMQGSQVLARLQSGEIDLNLPSLGVIPITDFESVQALSGLTTQLEEPIAHELMYINHEVMPGARMRQALLYGINRQMIVDNLLKGNGEVVDGMLTSYSPFYDESITATPYDPEKARQLLEESGWDFNQTLTFKVSSGDETMAQAANIIAANLADIGLKVQIQMTDLTTLLNQLYAQDFQLAMLQYSFMPADPYPDVSYLLGTGNVNGYSNARVDELLALIKSEDDLETVKGYYSELNRICQEEVPMFSVYSPRALTAVSNRVTGITARQYGAFIDVQNWDIAQ